MEIESQDLWLKVFLEMDSPGERSFESEFEIKCDQRMLGRKLKEMLQCVSISMWNKLCKEQQN